MPYYAVAVGRVPGIYATWDECKREVDGYKYAKYKKFETKMGADDFIAQHADSKTRNIPSKINVNNSNNNSNILSFLGRHTSVEIEPNYYVYTDGACINNGRPGAKAGIGIFFGENDTRNVSQPLEGKQTNNAAELSAIIKTYPIIEKDILSGKKIAIVTDSEYAIKCIKGYGEKCAQKGWVGDIPNKELVKEVYTLYHNIDANRFSIIYVKAHTQGTDVHSIGNRHADRLANEGAIYS